VMNNRHLLKQNEEGHWTFGQTLALALTIIPLMQVAQLIWNNKHYLVKWWERVFPSGMGGSKAVASGG